MTSEGDVAPLAYAFDADHSQHAEELVELLGGKGAGLALMSAMGLPVPPGFTLTTAACRSHLERGWSEEHEEAVLAGLAELEHRTGRRLGDPSGPLLVSVRSGSRVSMPGMLATVLNVGMTDEVAAGLLRETDDRAFVEDTRRRALSSYAINVCGIDADIVRAGSHAADVVELRSRLVEHGASFPADPVAQVMAAVRAVFDSWFSDRACQYRALERIDDSCSTAVTVQAMVFGNLGPESGTGVAFSRDPATGSRGLTGDFLVGAQGEDVVGGDHEPEPLVAMRERWPSLWNELDAMVDRLEVEFADMVDIEFTVERARLWVLQARRGRRSGLAALRVAIDMAEDPEFPLDREDAVRRCRPYLADPPTVDSGSPGPTGRLIAAGHAASPGVAVGVLCTDVDRAVALSAEGTAVVLVRRDTSPADIHGMAAAAGLVTTLGGPVSHAAVVARSWGLPAVVGAAGLSVVDGAVEGGGLRVEEGEMVTVDGDMGRFVHGAHTGARTIAPEVDVLRRWIAEATVDVPEDDA